MKMRAWPCFLVVGALSGCSGETIDAGTNAAGDAGDAGGGATLASEIQLPPLHLLSDGTTLFWTDEGGALLSMPAGGGAITNLAPMIPTLPMTLLSVDDVNLYLEFDNGIYRLPKAGGAPALISDPGTATAIGPATILGDTAYWSEQPVVDSGSSPRLVKSASLRGGPITLIAQLTPEDPAESTIGVTASTVFLEGPSATMLQKFPISTGVPEPISLASGCGTLVSDTDAVYCYFGGSVGPIQRIENDGATMPLGTMIDMSASASSALAVDDANVYWVDDTTIGTIMKVPKAGGTPTVIARDTSPIAIAVDATSVYWSDVGGDIRRVPK